jgi:hypothetical protein
LAITSVQHQCIYIHHITESGKLVKEVELGYYAFQDDSLFLAMYTDGECPAPPQVEERIPAGSYQYVISNDHVPNTNRTVQLVLSPPEVPIPEDQGFLGGLKQRIMSFLLKKAKERGTPQALHHFHLMFSYFTNLVMWKAQFLDSDNLIIKYGTIQNVVGKMECNSQTYFVFYCISKAHVFGVYDSSSQDMLDMFFDYDFFRNCSFPEDPYMGISIPSNSSHAKELVQRQIYTIQQSRNGGKLQAIRRIVSLLPLNPQSYSESPYFDRELFSYDEKVIGPNERHRPVLDFPCKFFDRKTGALRFKLDTNIAPLLPARGQK